MLLSQLRKRFHYQPALRLRCTQGFRVVNNFAVSLYIVSRIRKDVLILLASCQQNCMTNTSVVCTVKNSDDGQRNCPKHVKFYSKNKFENLVHLVGFIIRIKVLTVFYKRCKIFNILKFSRLKGEYFPNDYSFFWGGVVVWTSCSILHTKL